MRSRIAGFVIVVMLASGLPACSGPPQPGLPSEVNGGTQIVVPALWANGETGSSGIEPATVWVDGARTSDQLAYEVNLEDVQAKGGGAMWQAATSSAAAIGTLFSGRDPDDIAYRFDITGSIDGPSAGAILTVGVLAALNQHPLDRKTTMTGTISPDGSIGPVGLIPLKLKAAADAGFERIILPAMLTTLADPKTGERLDTKTYADRLGVEVIFVQTLAEAYLSFTGEELLASAETSPFVFSNFPVLDATRAEAASRLQQTVQRSIDATTGAPEPARSALADAKAASAGGDPSTGFALAVDALDQFANWRGSSVFLADVEQVGSPVARDRLLNAVTEQLGGIDCQLEQVVQDAHKLSAAQQLAFPGALGWLTYAQAVLESMRAQLGDAAVTLDDASLAAYAGLAQQVTDEADAVFPQAMLVLEATPGSSALTAQPVNEFLSGYTNFLVAAGDANFDYLRNVLSLSETEQSQYSVLDLVPVVAELGDEAQTIEPGVESLGSELEESSLAMTYFVASMSLVASYEVFGNADMWLSLDQAVDSRNVYVEKTISESDALVRAVANQLLTSNLNAGFAVWSADWGKSAYDDLSAREQTTRGSSLALNELWYDVITVLSMKAYLGSS